MLIIPAINCPDISCVESRLKVVRSIGAPWVQFDVSDGVFAERKTWDNAADLEASPLDDLMDGLNFEVHLMVESPQDAAEEWLLAGAARIIFQIESDYDIGALTRLTNDYNAHLMVSLCPDTPISELEKIQEVSEVQFLAVEPGPSGQVFREGTMERARELLETSPDATIEIDGGVTPQVAREAKRLGVYSVAVGSYIFKSDRPDEAYRELVSNE